MKKWFLLLMSCMLVFTLAQSAMAFSDTASSPHAKQIEALKKRGIVSGEADGKFNPNGKLTYASGVSMLVKGLDLSLARFLFNKAPLASDYYEHIKDGQWYSDAFIIAHVNGLDIPKDVKPNQHMTREQFAHLLMQAVETHGERAFIEIYILLEDEADVTPDYMNSIQKLLIANIATLGKDSKFRPKEQITRGDAASWLHGAIEFIESTPEIPDVEPQPNPFYDMKLESSPVNEQVNKVTVSAQAPHPGYGIRISLIEFVNKQAIIYTEPVLPDPDRMYPQVITEVKAETYIGSEYTPVLPASSSVESGPAIEPSGPLPNEG